MLRSSSCILLVSLALNPSLSAQDRSTAVPIVYPLFERTDLPALGIGHFLREDYVSGSFFALSEGLTYYIWKTTTVERDTLAYPCSPAPGILYRGGVRGLSSHQSALMSLKNYSHQTFVNLRLLDAFTTYRNYRAGESHTLPLSNHSIGGLLLSPFEWEYLREPDIYIPLFIAAGVSFLDESSGPSLFTVKSINWFGRDVSPATMAIGSLFLEATGFALLAVAEEGFFRGVLQTELSERVNPNFGLVASSVLFGLAHYQLHGLEYSLRATAAGLYLGWRFKKSAYDLRRTISLHFHLDFLPTLIQLFRDPLKARGTYYLKWE